MEGFDEVDETGSHGVRDIHTTADAEKFWMLGYGGHVWSYNEGSITHSVLGGQSILFAPHPKRADWAMVLIRSSPCADTRDCHSTV